MAVQICAGDLRDSDWLVGIPRCVAPLVRPPKGIGTALPLGWRGGGSSLAELHSFAIWLASRALVLLVVRTEVLYKGNGTYTWVLATICVVYVRVSLFAAKGRGS